MKIEFYPSSKEVSLVVPPPKPAAFYTPAWYKKIEKFSEKDLDSDKPELAGPNVKSCVPFFDAMTAGYIQETWQDIVVDYRNDNLSVMFPVTPKIMETRKRVSIPIGKEFYPTEFVWFIPWMPKVPDGWSLMFSHPHNAVHLPYQSTTGIMDSDVFYHIPFGNYPFFIKEGFRGIIPKGSPMFQITPIKREEWKSEVKKWDADEQLKREYKSRSTSFGGYRKFFHIKKEFK